MSGPSSTFVLSNDKPSTEVILEHFDRNLPDPVLDIDFIGGEYFWDGLARAVSDLETVSGDAYYLDYNLDFDDVAVVVIDIQFDGTPSGTIFSWTSGYPAGNRIEFNVGGDPGNPVSMYISPLSGGGGAYQNFDGNSLIGEADTNATADWTGIHRLVVRIKSGDLVKFAPDNGQFRSGVRTAGTLDDPTRIGFSCRAYSSSTPDQLFSGGTLRRITVYNGDLTESAINSICRDSVALPVHMLGDSFLNGYKIFERLLDNTDGIGYVPLSQDGLGSTSLAQQAVRFGLNADKWHSSTLVICDFGLGETASTAISAIRAMIDLLPHDRWIYMQPAPGIASPSADRTAADAELALIAAFCGTHYVSTLDEAFAESDGSAGDLAEVVKRLWPLSLKTSVADFHPNTAGDVFVAGLIHAALVSRGWLPDND